MDVFDFFNDIIDKAQERKFNMEMERGRQEALRDDAKRCLESAKDTIRIAKDRYNSAYEEANAAAAQASNDMRNHVCYKESIAKELDESVSVRIREFRDFNIDSRTIPSFPKIKIPSSINIDSVENFTRGIVSPDPISLLLEGRSAEEEYRKAKEQLDAARRYKSSMDAETAKLEAYQSKMESLCDFISVEKEELDSLMKKLRKMSGELKAAMQKRNFTEDEANYLKGIQKISESIISLLKTEFLSEGLSVSRRYQDAFSKIKSINQNIPTAPSITDGSTVSAIRKILDGTVAY